MKLYDFSIYARIREAEKAARAVAAVDTSRPGSVVELKNKVTTWFNLHQEVIKRSA